MLLEVEEIFGSRNELGIVQEGTTFTSCVHRDGEQARSAGRCGDGEQARSAGWCGASQPRVARRDIGAG